MDQQTKKSEACQIFELLVSKATSARFIATLLVIWTLCKTVETCLGLSITAAANKETFAQMKDIIMFILGAFVTTVTSVVTSYFNRPDRVGKPEELEPTK